MTEKRSPWGSVAEFRTWAQPRCREPRDDDEELNSATHGKPCLLWNRAMVNGGRNPRGRVAGVDGQVNPRREAWKLANPGRELPGNQPVVPCCGNTACIEPSHMKLEKHGFQNVGRIYTVMELVRFAKTARANQAKVPQEVVQTIRAADTRPAREIGAELGVHHSTVNNWRAGRTRKDLEAQRNPFAQLLR